MEKWKSVLACLLALWTAGGDARETETGIESFLVITDTHLTRDPREHAAMMEAVLQAARGRDAVLLLEEVILRQQSGSG